MAALREVRRTGKGALLDFSRTELTTLWIGEESLAASVDAADPIYPNGQMPRGNNPAGLLSGSDGTLDSSHIENIIDF